MGNWSRRLCSGTIAIFLTGSGAWADVTAEQVWTDFKTYLEAFGYTVNGTEQTSGGTLTVTDLALNMDTPEAGSTASIIMDNISFAETGDGRVRVTMPQRMPIAFTARPPEDGAEDVAGTIDYTQSGFEMIVSGAPGDMQYDYGASDMAFALSSLTVDGQAVEIGQASMSLSDVAGRSNMSGTTLRVTEQTMTAAAMTYVVDIANPDDPTGRIAITGGLSDLGFKGAARLPADVDMTDMSTALSAGFSVDGGYSYESGSSEFAITGAGQDLEGNTSSESGRLSFQMDETTMTYAGEVTGLAMNYAGTEIPLPVSVSMAKAGFNMLFPIGETEEPTDFGLGLTLADVTVSDAIWGMVDPAGQIPRDPATIELNLTGKARLTQNLMGDQAMMMAAGAPPGEIHALSVNALTLAIAGARLTGGGDFTFDNEDLSTFPGMPKPTGALDLQLTGGNALLDTLVAMGLLPQEQAMGARMMLGMFARPGSGPDSLTSRIEVTEDGQVLANGQRLR